VKFFNKQIPFWTIVPSLIVAIGLFIATIGTPRIWIPIVLSSIILFYVLNNARLKRRSRTLNQEGNSAPEGNSLS
jgi:apolipoprotein N-acyltransferase